VRPLRWRRLSRSTLQATRRPAHRVRAIGRYLPTCTDHSKWDAGPRRDRPFRQVDPTGVRWSCEVEVGTSVRRHSEAMSSATHEIEPAGPDASDAPSLSDGCRLSRTLPTAAQSLSAEMCAAPRRLVATLRDIGRPNVAAGFEQLLDNWSPLPQPDSTGAPPADRHRGTHRLDRRPSGTTGTAYRSGPSS
jgi:hypothetical protein